MREVALGRCLHGIAFKLTVSLPDYTIMAWLNWLTHSGMEPTGASPPV